MNSPTTTPSPETTDTATAAANHCRIFTDQPNLPTTTPLLLKPAAAAGDELRRFRISLKWCLLDHSSPAGRLLSYAAFALLALFVPALAALSVRDDDAAAAAAAADPVHLNKLVQLPLSGLAAAAFLALAPHGRLRHLLLLLGLDASADTGPSLRRRHAAELDRAFRRLALILLPSLLAELAHKLVFFSSVTVAAPSGAVSLPLNSVLFVLVVASWVYRSGVFLLVCVMFRLTCELQILRFEGFQRMLEVGGETASCWEIFREHMRIRKQLGVTSHRYRFFIIWSLFIITVSQFGALLLVLGSKTEKNFLNSGDLVVCSAVEISGFFVCLVGAARITHRAQRLVSIATRWHMLVTCASSSGPDHPKAHNIDHHDQPDDHDHDDQRCGQSDSDHSDHLISVPPQDPSSFQTRQALVAYLQHNGGGITLFGFALDRGLLHTLFAFEFSLVLWILSKVVVLS